MNNETNNQFLNIICLPVNEKWSVVKNAQDDLKKSCEKGRGFHTKRTKKNKVHKEFV